MNRLIIEIDGKYNEGVCGAPHKIPYPPLMNAEGKGFETRKHDVLENYGRLHLYKNGSSVASIDHESELPLIRSCIVLVLGLSEVSLNEVIELLLKMKSSVIEIEVFKDQRKRVYLIVVFRNLPPSQQFFSRYQFRLMGDNSHLLCLFLKDIIYLRNVESERQKEILLLGKTEPDSIEWMQLPTCMSCLQKIECKVSGINYIIASMDYGPDPKMVCSLCQLLRSKQLTKCRDCSQISDLWACLVCGHVGCGRYKEGHAQDHRTKYNHTLAIELSTERIWNYDSDSFAHRIIKSGAGYEVMNFPEYEFDDMKLESMQGLFWEYCNKFSEQLEKQRLNFKSILQDLQIKHKWEQKSLIQQLGRLEEKRKQKQKEYETYKSKKAKLQKRKEQLINQIASQKDINKLLEKQLKASKKTQSEAVLNKKKQIKELEEKVAKLLGQLQFL